VASDGCSLFGMDEEGQLFRYRGTNRRQILQADIEMSSTKGGLHAIKLRNKEATTLVANYRSKQLNASAWNCEVWAADDNDNVRAFSDKWSDVAGKRRQVSSSTILQAGSCGLVWGVDGNQRVHCCWAFDSGGQRPPEGWSEVRGRLCQVATSADGCHIWGVNSEHDVFYRAGLWGEWLPVGGKLIQVACSSDGYRVWGLDPTGNLWECKLWRNARCRGEASKWSKRKAAKARRRG